MAVVMSNISKRACMTFTGLCSPALIGRIITIKRKTPSKTISTSNNVMALSPHRMETDLSFMQKLV
jgi:hypothetical protein